jgi:rsbT antagonist protein RsbS
MNHTNNVTCISLWDCLIVPLCHDVSDSQADETVAEVLERVHQTPCFGVLFDLSRIWTLDGYLSRLLIHLAHAAKVVGTKTVLSGMHPDIAKTLQAMGIELRGIEVFTAIEDALGSMGITGTAKGGECPKPALFRRFG